MASQGFSKKIYILMVVTILFLYLMSCSPKHSPNIPDLHSNTDYIEGNEEGSDTLDGETVEGNNGGAGYEGPQDGTQEGESSNDGTFTSAVTFDTREVDYGEPETTTGEEGSDSNRELIEPDVIRKWENFLLVLNQFRGLTIVDLNEKKVVSNLPIFGYPRDLYIKNGYAVVLIGYTISHTIEDDMIKKITGAKAVIVDISNIYQPKILSSILLPGDFIDSRIVGEILYAVTSDYSYYYEYASEDNTTSSEDSTWYTESGNTCWITSINLKVPSSPELVKQINFPGYGTVVQATTNSIYVCTPEWETGNTLITYVDISDPNGNITLYPPVEVPGYVADKFKLDEWQNHLRVASNTWWNNRNTFITVFDVSNPANIQLCSQTLLPEAQGETLYATRFAENYLYLVTYLTIDPLFVVDLSDPYNPEVKGELKVPGWSVHIEPVDHNQLIALGIDDQDNQRRVKVSWFDVSDPTNPIEVSTVSIGEGWVWSSAYSDVKSFTIIEDYVIVPFSGWLDNSYKERLQFIKWQKEENSLISLGFVEIRGQALRTIKHADYFYSITTEYVHEIELNNEEQPFLTGVDIPIAENVADVLEINNANNIVEIISDTEKSIFHIRLKGNPNDILDTLELKTSGYYFDAIKVTEDIIGVVLNEWDTASSYNLNYRVVLIKVSADNSHPKLKILRDELLPLTPIYYWGYWGYDILVYRPAPYYYWNYGSLIPNEHLFVVGDKLIIRGRGEKFDITLGNETTPLEGFAIVSTSPDTGIMTVGLGLSNIVNLIESDGRVFLTTQKFIDSREQPLTSYYLSEIYIDPIAMTEPINVPGVITSANSSKGIYFLKDWQYTESDSQSIPYYYPQYETWFRSIEIVDGKVNILDSVNTKLSWAQFYNELSEYLIYLENQSGYLTLHKYEISSEGKFINYSEKNIGESLWGEITLIRKPYVYISVDGASIAKLELDNPQGILFSNLTSLYSYPQKYREGKDHLYIISGLGGWNKVAL